MKTKGGTGSGEGEERRGTETASTDSEGEGPWGARMGRAVQVGGVGYMQEHSGGLLISAELPPNSPWASSH